MMMKQFTLLLCISLPLVVNGAFWDSATEKDDEKKSVPATVPATPTHVQPTRSGELTYGVDVSFPMHHPKVSDNYDWLPHNLDTTTTTPRRYRDMAVQPLGDRQSLYDAFIDSCKKAYPKQAARCISTERDRVEMSLRQPQSMQNYTDVGFKKLKAPESLFKLLKEFWERNNEKMKPEQWGAANTYTNNWDSPSFMVSVEDSSLRGGGFSLKQKIWDAARTTLGEWTQEELTQCSLYGIRVYKEGAVLAPHVDRLPLVSSAIINVAQDVDEPWPLEVYGHDGKAHNVTMEPGDMVLYESHSVIHGRPFALKGRFMANVFIHFEPTGHSLRHGADDAKGDVDKKYRDSAAKGVGGHETDHSGLPPYIVPGSPEESHWRKSHPNGFAPQKKSSFSTGSYGAHEAAKNGQLTELHGHVKANKEVIHKKDVNGWTPLHEGARGGYLDVVKFLVESGADVNGTTSNGGSTLWWAKQTHGTDHEVVKFLEEMGAIDVGPEL